MDLTYLIAVIIIYCVLYFFDSFFKSCAHYPYIQFLKGTGLKIKPFSIRWTTTAFNRIFLRWGSSHSKLLNSWFTTGLYVSLFLLPISVGLLLFSVSQNFYLHSDREPLITPLIPGINLASSEIVYYSSALALSSIIHEVGHAIAAVKEDVHIISVGIDIFFILPVAYVNLSTESLLTLEPWKRLKILCAGVWHNLVLSVLGYMIYLLLPIILSYFFIVGEGVTIYNALQTSPLIGSKGIQIGDLITKVNDCVISDEQTWYTCLETSNIRTGFCFDADVIHNFDESIQLKYLGNDVVECCDKSKKENLCFEYLDSNNGILELPTHVCLSARRVLAKSNNYCQPKVLDCPINLHCFRAITDNQTNLFKIKCKDKTDVIYIGKGTDFVNTLQVSNYTPRFLFKSVQFPEVLKKFLEYITLISLGLAVINIIPCMFMDGQHITNTLSYLICSKHIPNQSISLLALTTSGFFTVILVVHCFYTVYLKLNIF